MDLIDIGINLTHESYEADREAVIARAVAAGVRQLIVTGASLAGSFAASALAAAHARVLFATAGVHPHHADGFSAETLVPLRELLRSPAVVAVGECGLDYYRNFSSRQGQRRAFTAQLTLAIECGKPLFLHQRDAHEDFVSILREYRTVLPRGVAHCFTAGEAELEAYLELGLAIGITGWICDERRGRQLQSVVARIPAGRLLLETDGPYLLPRDLKPAPPGRRNEPMLLPHIASAVAHHRGESLQECAAHTSAASRSLFGLPPP
ncbi:MAG: TatD family hydrolase [Steroidobacteraceae bacterium]|jgi:TatD DNase family protein